MSDAEFLAAAGIRRPPNITVHYVAVVARTVGWPAHRVRDAWTSPDDDTPAPPARTAGDVLDGLWVPRWDGERWVVPACPPACEHPWGRGLHWGG